MSETCTMGGADGYMLGVVIGFPFVFIAAWLNIRTAKTSRFHKLSSSVITLLSCLFIGAIWVDIFISTVFYGNHICGREYNEYVSEIGTIYWYLPVAQLTLILVLITSVIKRVRA
ncbi:hypothetical protein [Marinomonas mediterranea]|uniref:hypothetical protein n=1 Tax=Marinomonas mediterranea TaxID=119864 RepID=UPI00234B97E1|nr:hypothetical protein [Marinomonas mediterranea]WCN11008.1 hypothetical protein GV055_19760 [Marinomonas mediterranea]